MPAASTSVPNNGRDLSGGADKKWDTSRQMRRKVINPNNINFDLMHAPAYSYYAHKPDYPTNDACGNDDVGTGDPEDNDPYNAPYAGAIHGPDNPTRGPFHSEGALGDTFEIRQQFRGFARVELNGTWYRISDWFLWRIHFKCKKQNENEKTWNLNFNGDGTIDDVNVPVWRDDGSSIAKDNAGF